MQRDQSDQQAATAEVLVRIPPIGLEGALTLPVPGSGLVLFVHGSGSSQYSPRNRRIAQVLQARGLGTFLFDLLTVSEASDRANLFDIDLLAARLRLATRWLVRHFDGDGFPIGYFGASTGAAAALVAAADLGREIGAVVLRGGRPDLAGAALPVVVAPTLLIVGGADPTVLALNRQAMSKMTCTTRLEIIADASHLFEESGALDQVALLAAEWFGQHLGTVEEDHVQGQA